MTSNTEVEEKRERLLKNVKKEVKQIMEESVTKKFVHEESSSITSLCGAVETCLQDGLKKRALGLFKNSTTTALLHKVSKTCEQAAQVVKVVIEHDNSNDSRKSLDNNKNLTGRKGYQPRYQWIRVALLEKQLAKILDHLVQYNSKYYEKDALIADPVDGPILASLLVGPCALDYTKMKTADHYWTDPPADELIQRHRIHSSATHLRQDSPKRPGLQVTREKLQVRRHTSSSSEENIRATPLSAKEYVESLHQNSKSTLLYGKNNVLVQPKEDMEPLPGYLSLHQGPQGLTVKWTPNQLMNGCCEKEQEEEGVDRRPIYTKFTPHLHQKHNKRVLYDNSNPSAQVLMWGGIASMLHQFYYTFTSPKSANSKKTSSPRRKIDLYWDYAVTVFMDEIVYLHCHQQPDSGGTLVLVGQDGVQRPPIHFPKGGHMLAFLSCMENGLLPRGQLDPPLWSQRGKGKVFPKLKKKGSRIASMLSQGSEDQVSVSQSTDSNGSQHMSAPSSEDEEATDYVFRIITTFRPDTLPPELLDPKAKDEGKDSDKSSSPFPWLPKEFRYSFSSSSPPPPVQATQQNGSPVNTPSTGVPSGIQSYAKSQQKQNNTAISKATQSRTAVKQLCDTMTRQILSRAFYGWLSHCRHLKTVRTHLSGLVNSTVISVEVPHDASQGLTVERWAEMSASGVVSSNKEIYRLVYYGTCSHEIRKEVWPYLLGHYKFDTTVEEREDHDCMMRKQYENTMSEWLAVEAIVRQRDKELVAASLAKLSQESQDGHIPLMRKDSSLSNDVFESMDSDDFSHPETVPEESSSATSPVTESMPVTSSADTMVESEAGDQAHQTLSAVRSVDSKDTSSCSPDEGLGDSLAHTGSLGDSRRSDSADTDKNVEPLKSETEEIPIEKSIIVTNPSVDQGDGETGTYYPLPSYGNDHSRLLSTTLEDTEHLSASRESLISPCSPVSNASNGGIYSAELLDGVALNLHRIDKDVQRCDRNYSYFTPSNLDKLRNIICTYVWEHLEVGYLQGMCDLVAPLLVVFDDEALTYSCFCHLMKRMSSNFPTGGAMDQHFANMRSLIQILDPELFEHMHQNGDYTHFYFCYRWFLLDFKRELKYEDVFSVWESIWVAKHISSPHFVLFIALALVEYYREIIIDNNMDFTDIIKFFNEMAERHNAKQILRVARDLVYKLQDLIENK